VLIPVVGAGVGARTPRPAILEGHRVRGEHDEPGPGQRRRKGLERFADESEHLRLAEVTLARMLMKGDNAGERTITGGDGDERRDGVAVDLLHGGTPGAHSEAAQHPQDPPRHPCFGVENLLRIRSGIACPRTLNTRMIHLVSPCLSPAGWSMPG
jgi:hypothetical protein